MSIIDPNAHAFEKVLDEISAVLKKHGYVLGFDRDSIVLGKISDGVGLDCIVVAQIQQIAPTHSTYRPVIATKTVRLIQ